MNLDTNTSLALMNATQPDVQGNVSKTKMASLSKNEKQVDAAAKDFEAMFMTQMLQPMFDGIKTNKMFGGGKGEEIFKGFMLEEYGRMVADTGQLGIADMIKGEMIRMQEESQK